MIKLTIYGSSSKGNCYLLDNGNTKICLDLGVKNIEQKINMQRVDGIVITHSHSDHCKAVKDVKNYYSGKFYANKDTLDILPILDNQKEEVIKGQSFEIKDFTIMPFELMHDVLCYGYLVKDKISNTKLLYVTDTGSIPYQFRDIDYFLIESNCFESDLTYENYKEIRLYDTHLSAEQTANFLVENVNHNTKKVILGHISSSEEDYMKHQKYVSERLSNENIEVIALDPHLKDSLKVILKDDLKGFDFD